MGFTSGTLTAESTSQQVALPSDGITIGNCNAGDTWPHCTGGCNDLTVGGSNCGGCREGDMAGIRIDCEGMKIWKSVSRLEILIENGHWNIKKT